MNPYSPAFSSARLLATRKFVFSMLAVGDMNEDVGRVGRNGSWDIERQWVRAISACRPSVGVSG